MTVQGTIRGGVVVLDQPIQVPDGTKVAVIVSTSSSDKPLDEAHARRIAALEELLAIPNENPGDNFSGADHDKILYGGCE
jgi:hypothetical protein